MSKEKKISIWNSVSFVLISCLTLINFTLNVKTYNVTIFGVYILLSSIFNLGNSLDFGFGVSTVKIISESKINDYKDLDSVLLSFFSVYLCLATLLCLGFSGYFYFFFKGIVPAEVYNLDLNYKLFFQMMNFTFFFKYLTSFLNKVFDGLQEFILFAKLNIIYNICFSICVFLIFYFKLTLFYLILLTLVGNASFFLLLFITLIFKLKIKFRFHHIDFKLIKKNLKYNFNLQLSFFINSFMDPIIKFLIANFLSLNFVTFFETAKKIIDLTNGLIFSAQKNLLNNLSEANHIGKLKDFIQTKIFKYARLSNYYSLVVYGILNPFIFIFINYWFNTESAIIYLMFSISYSFINFGGSKYLVLMIDSNGKYLLFIQIANLVSTTVLLYFSLSVFNSYMGLTGFIISTTLSLIIIMNIMRKNYELPVFSYLKKTFLTRIFIMNLLIAVELISLIMFFEYKFYILGFFFLTFVVLFHKHLFEVYNMFMNKQSANA